MTIRQKQWQLYYLGYYGGEIDGIWGSQSKAAAVHFQEDSETACAGDRRLVEQHPILLPKRIRLQMRQIL